MKPVRGPLAATGVPASVAAFTTWVAMFSWEGFTRGAEAYLGRLLVLAGLVALVGAVGRWYRLSGLALFPLQVLAVLLVGSALVSGAWLPVGHGYHELIGAFSDAVSSSQTYASPVPTSVPSISPLLVSGGAVCLLLVDLLACTLHRVPLAGLPLLGVFSVPISLLGGGINGAVFVVTAFGFMALLYLHEHDQVAKWGRSLGPGGKDAFEAGGLGAGGAGLRRSAGSIGGVATVMAIALPLVIPTFTLHVFDFGPGPGHGGSGIKVVNPIVDLRRNLQQGADVPLLQVTTDGPDPTYLRIAVLTRFSGNKWSSGNRQIPTDQTASGLLPELEGVDPSIPRTPYEEHISVSKDFASHWLPTQAPISKIEASGDWRYDTSTMDFIAGNNDLTTAGLSYDQTAIDLSLSSADLELAPLALDEDPEFTDLPSGLPAIVKTLATQVTRGAHSPFEQAVALQTWFRSAGGFTYDLSTSLGDGTDDLVHFLTPGTDGRRGYCQQFAAAMAVMARELGIPARVAVGFLSPTETSPGTYVYSSHDMHAWPELYFPGSGWVRFEPTPATRASGIPSYTRIGDPSVSDPPINDTPSATASTTKGPNFSDKPTGVDQEPSKGTKPQTTGSGSHLVLLILLALLLLALVVVAVPVLVRRRRRTRHLAGGPEDVWRELRDTAADLRLGWPRDRSPRETRRWLSEHFGGPPDQVRQALASVDVIVLALERTRYSRSPGVHPDLVAPAEDCLAALAAGVHPSARRRAALFPASVLSRTPRRRAAAPTVLAPTTNPSRTDELVDAQ